MKIKWSIEYVEELLNNEVNYPEEVKSRVLEVLRGPWNKYQYLHE